MIFRNLTSVGMKNSTFFHLKIDMLHYIALYIGYLKALFSTGIKHYSQAIWFCFNVAGMNDKVKKDILQCNKVTKLFFIK